MTEILKAVKINKSFDGRVNALSDVDLTVNKGDFISILGPSGSGKSTLLTILGGMDVADRGEVFFEGRELGKMKENELAKLRRTKVGFVFQFFNLAPYLTVEENIFLPIVLEGKSIRDSRERFKNLVNYLKIDGIVSKLPAELSGGEQQRTAIARALIYEPDVIFLDEPTGNLDSVSAEEIMKLLKQVNREMGTTVLQVTHSERNALYGNRIIVISDGKIVREKDISEEPGPETDIATDGESVSETEEAETENEEKADIEKEEKSENEEEILPKKGECPDGAEG